MHDIFVYASFHDKRLDSSSAELIYKARLLAAEYSEKTDGSSCSVTAVMAGDSNVASAADEAGRAGADRVITVSAPWLAVPHEPMYASEIYRLVLKYKPDIMLITADSFGRGLAPRLSSRLKTGLTADCTSLEIEHVSGLLLQTRPAFGGNLFATMTCPQKKPQMATVRPNVFPMPPETFSKHEIISEDAVTDGTSDFQILEMLSSSDEINIGDANILVSVGRGADRYIDLAYRLADLLGGTVSASRPLIDDGLMPYPRQVGQTGKTVSPDLYIAVGISGSVQHLAGIAAKKVAAVNTDPDAPIFRHADFGLIADSGEFLRRTIEILNNRS